MSTFLDVFLALALMKICEEIYNRYFRPRINSTLDHAENMPARIKEYTQRGEKQNNETKMR